MINEENAEKKEWEANFEIEFLTVEELVKSLGKTGRTDAFILVWPKLEKQMRKIVAFLFYRLSVNHSIDDIKKALDRPDLYGSTFEKIFNGLYYKKFEEIVGQDYIDFQSQKDRIQYYRNKILHGQSTGDDLSKEDLENEIEAVKKYVKSVAEKIYDEIGYDGLKRGALDSIFKRKSSDEITYGEVSDETEVKTIQWIEDVEQHASLGQLEKFITPIAKADAKERRDKSKGNRLNRTESTI